jgi:hypothetical protein
MTNREIAQQILDGKWPEETFHPDFQMELIHQASIIFYDLDGKRNPEAIKDGINNLALWIGGLHLDMQVYAWQYLRRYCGFEVLADDKTTVRLAHLEERIFSGKAGYTVHFAKDITAYHWPTVYLDGTTYEEHVEALIEELDLDLDSGQLTGDLVLSGQARGPADTFEENCRVIKEVCEGLKATLEKYGKPNIIFYEQGDRFITWLGTLDIELAVMGIRAALAIYRLPFNVKEMKNFADFARKVAPYTNNK